jgi:uncharacterized membrane protein
MLRGHVPDIIGILVVCLVMLVGYFEIPFEGKTFSTASYTAGFNGCGSHTSVRSLCTARKRGDPRPDLAASSWFLEPSAQVVHHEIANGNVPLWNPGEGIGAPLAGNPQTAAFDPLMLAVFLHPTELIADLSTLLWLLLIGVAAYLFARALRLSPLPATVVGVVYGLSGWFFAYSNLWFFRVYLFLPLILATIEWTIRTKRRLPPAMLGISLGWIVLVGMPEPMFISVVAACVFAGARLLLGDREGTRRRAALRLVGGATLGVALGGPLLLGFREYLPLSFNGHSFNGQPPATDSVYQFLDWMMPRIATASAMASARAASDDRQWIGAGAVILAAIALCHPRTLRRYAGWPLVLVSAVVGGQMYGAHFVAWTAHIPIWAQVLWTRWGTPVLALPVALLAGIGLQTVLDGAIERRAVVAAFLALVGVVAAFIVLDNRDLDLWQHVNFRGGWPVAALTIAVVVLATLLLRSHLAAVVIAVVVILELLLLAPHGIYANRGNPYPSEPWISFLQSNTQDHSRVFSTQGILYPDIATAYGLSDLRVLDALYPKRYWNYLTTFVSHGLVDRFTAVQPSGVPNIASNPMFDLLGVRYLMFRDRPAAGPPSESRSQFRVVYRSGGVRIFENLHVAPRAFVVHDLHAVPNMTAALQLLTRENSARFPDGSVRVEQFDPRSSAVIEAKAQLAENQSCADNAASTANIVSYSATDMKIEVTNDCPGLLVVSDEYYPGWSATVNGRHASIYPTDVAMRGVPIPAGSSTVELHYAPASFRNGLILFAVGLIALGLLATTGLRSSRWWRSRRPLRNDPTPEAPEAASTLVAALLPGAAAMDDG